MTALLAPPEVKRCTDCGDPGGRKNFGRRLPGRIHGRCLNCDHTWRRRQRALARIDAVAGQPPNWAGGRPSDAVVAERVARQAKELADRLNPEPLAVLDPYVPLYRVRPALWPAAGAILARLQYEEAERSLAVLRDAVV